MTLQTPDPFSGLPIRCDVLVIGAGPAGSACARTLAQAGVDVVLADQHAFPRDKVCGDGLIPDAYAALTRLGVLDQVMAHAQPASHVGCIGPSGGRIDVPGTMAVLPRRQLDDILCKAAVAAGARLLPPARFEAPLEEAGCVVGARLKLGDSSHEIRARWLVLATGAVPQALIAAGMCERRTPSGIALRGYVKNDAMVGRVTALEVVWHRKLRPGYGWIFPCRDGVFNIGVGIAHSHNTLKNGRLGMKDVNLREVFDAFTRVYAPARELMAGGVLQGELKGAPLRCTRAPACSSPARPQAPPIRSPARASARHWRRASTRRRRCWPAPTRLPTMLPCAPTTRRGCWRSSRASTCTRRPTASTSIPGSPTW